MATFEILGEEKVQRALAKMTAKVGGKLLRRAMRAAAKPIRDTAKELCPVDTGSLKDSIKIRAGKRKSGSIAIKVETNYYGDFVEYGHIVGRRLKGKFISNEAAKASAIARGRSVVPAHPFLRPAFDRHVTSSKEIAAKIILDGIKGGKWSPKG